jgi:mono/diheme cytochrome c family protein
MGCMERPLVLGTVGVNLDRPAVAEHYQFRHRGTCNAWVKSRQTGYMYCSSPAIPREEVATAAARAVPTLKDGPTDTASLQAHGEKVYASTCQACHQADGKGMAGTFPPLAGSGAFYGDAQNHARIIVHGLSGEIEVQGQKFNGSMPPQGGTFTDYDVAAVATYERLAWGNSDGPVLPADVAAVR